MNQCGWPARFLAFGGDSQSCRVGARGFDTVTTDSGARALGAPMCTTRCKIVVKRGMATAGASAVSRGLGRLLCADRHREHSCGRLCDALDVIAPAAGSLRACKRRTQNKDSP